MSDAGRRVAARGPEALKQVRRIVRRLLDRHHVAAKLFLDDDGQLKPSAKKWFQQLAEDGFVNGGAWHADQREHARREGARELALKIMQSVRLDVDRLEALTHLEKEVQ